ncbi:collagen alpha-1(I) chain-like [Catharus ustulatus]|uniref:collagen alpha-1(I) chain-like n=1 Tax=Catharus ustulatus TaxID=91951 RepID=UPI00140D36A2|nr:collagen alpha-1(I) chain-like [Catharus ustulatus]
MGGGGGRGPARTQGDSGSAEPRSAGTAGVRRGRKACEARAAGCSRAAPGRGEERWSSLPPAAGKPPSRRTAVPCRSGAAGCRLSKRSSASSGGGRRQGDSPGLGGTALETPLPPPGGGAVRLFWLPAASGGRGDTAPAAGEKRRGCSGANRGCRRKMVLLGKQHPPLPPLSPARAVCSPLIARRGHPAPAAPPSRDGYIQRLLSRNFPGTASCDRTRSGASAAIAASRGRRTEPPPLSRRGSGRRSLPRGPPASSSSARGAAGDAQAKIPFMTKEGGNNVFYSPAKRLLLEMIFTLFLKSMPSLLVFAGDVSNRSRREHELSSGTCDSRDLLQVDGGVSTGASLKWRLDW